MEGSEEGGQALKVNNGGERSPKTLVGSRKKKGIYRWGKSGRWKQIPPKKKGISQDSTQDVTAGWHGDGGDEGAGDGDDDDDEDLDEVWCIGDDDGDDLPSPGRNFPGRFLPARELFSLWCFPPRRRGGVYL
jgi:hypothetical protein